ncbi:MAG TPA: hypothetical protein VKX28_11285 [Xanthobacteraceae bacterium]|nr:hypothetical protein [Xanthobacteraceae bacterium]
MNTTLTSVAKDMNVAHPAVRQWLTRERFPATGLQQLMQRLGLPTDIEELKRIYGIEVSSAPVKPVATDVTEVIRSFVPPPAEEDLGAEVIKFLRSMNEWDAFAIWSIDELPFELTDIGWKAVGTLIASSIYHKNIVCIYVHPSEAELTRLRKVCGLVKMPHADLFEDAFARFKQKLRASDIRDLSTDLITVDERALDERTGNPKPMRLTDDQIRDHVIKIEAHSAAFCAPHHVFVMSIPARKPVGALAQFPTGDSEIVRKRLLSLGKDATIDLHNFLIACMETIGPHRDIDVVRTLAPGPERPLPNSPTSNGKSAFQKDDHH